MLRKADVLIEFRSLDSTATPVVQGGDLSRVISVVLLAAPESGDRLSTNTQAEPDKVTPRPLTATSHDDGGPDRTAAGVLGNPPREGLTWPGERRELSLRITGAPAGRSEQTKQRAGGYPKTAKTRNPRDWVLVEAWKVMTGLVGW